MSENDSKKILNKYINDVYTDDEANAFFELLANNHPNDDELIEECMQSVWNDAEVNFCMNHAEHLSRHSLIFESEARLLLERNKKKQRILSFSLKTKRRLAVACSFLLVCLFAALGYTYRGLFIDSHYPDMSISTSYGELRTIDLPDGTHVELNSKSKITYPSHFTGNYRQVALCGEAYFHVSKNKKMPFVITAGQLKVKVLGTRFDVKAYPKDIINSVSVERGKVQVDMPESMTRLVANEHMAINKETNSYIKFDKKESVAVWRTGTFRFLKTPIKDVFNELERKYRCQVVFDTTQFNNYITGELPDTGLESVLKSIALTTGIHYRYDAKQHKIFLFK